MSVKKEIDKIMDAIEASNPKSLEMVEASDFSPLMFIDQVKDADLKELFIKASAKEIETKRSLEDFINSRSGNDDKILNKIIGLVLDNESVNLPAIDILEAKRRNISMGGSENIWTRSTLLVFKLRWNTNKHIESTLHKYIDSIEDAEVQEYSSSSEFLPNLYNLSLQGIYNLELAIKMMSKFNPPKEEAALVIYSSSNFEAEQINYLFPNLDWNKKINVMGLSEKPTVSLGDLYVAKTLEKKFSSPDVFLQAVKKIYPQHATVSSTSGSLFLNHKVMGDDKKKKVSVNIHGLVGNLEDSGRYSNLYQMAKRENVVKKHDFIEIGPKIESKLKNDEVLTVIDKYSQDKHL